MPVWSMREGEMPVLIGELRELKTKRLSFARALDVLKDNQSVISALKNKPANVDSLILSLIEITKQQASNLGVEVLLLSVTDSNETQDLSALDGKSLHLFRVEFTGILQRATDLLWLFEGVREIADWRPMEVRGCSLAHQADLNGLHAACTIDVYYFPELGA